MIIVVINIIFIFICFTSTSHWQYLKLKKNNKQTTPTLALHPHILRLTCYRHATLFIKIYCYVSSCRRSYLLFRIKFLFFRRKIQEEICFDSLYPVFKTFIIFNLLFFLLFEKKFLSDENFAEKKF